MGALPPLSTDRLRLRPVTHDDLELLVGLNADPAVMTYVRGRAATREETVAEWRQRWERQSDADRGLGYWVGFDDGGFVGIFTSDRIGRGERSTDTRLSGDRVESVEALGHPVAQSLHALPARRSASGV